jgi:Zn-dependent protease
MGYASSSFLKDPLLGSIAALLVIGTLFLHELGHVWVASRYQLSTSAIIFHALGLAAVIDGLAGERDKLTPWNHFLIAMGGPLVNVLIAIALIPAVPLAPSMVIFIIVANIILAVFNLLPIFPLDGGRVLQSVTWALSGSWDKGMAYTRWVSLATGLTVGSLLVLFDLSHGNWLGALWDALIIGLVTAVGWNHTVK